MGRVRPAMSLSPMGYWLLGLPLGGCLALRADWGRAGGWWGRFLGIGAVASSPVVFAHLRGPAAESVAP